MDTSLSSLWQQAQQYELAGNLAQAELSYRGILKVDPGSAQAWHALGLLAFSTHNLEAAFQNIAQAVRLNPQVTLYHRNLGEIARRFGRLEQAILSGKAACVLSPNDLDAHYNLGLAYTDTKEYSKAIVHYRKAIKINPKHGLSWNNLGSALEQQGDKKAALKAYEKAVAINPQHAEAQNNQGAIYSEEGNLEEARISFAAAIAARPEFVEAHYNLSSLKTYQLDDPHLAMLEKVYADREQLSSHARIRYDFALGKALDDIGQYDRAFAAYEEGNRLQHHLLPCDERRADQLVDAIINTFTPEFIASKLDQRVPTLGKGKTPIFIVGMPRSGTTLLEQILSSHPSVFGAGELTILNEVISEITKTSTDHFYTQDLARLSKANWQKIGKNYLQRTWTLSPKSAFITDKMPANFFYLGLIYLTLPNAKIIHAMRDPMDSCFSCYSRLFNDTMEFAYDQETLGRYYQRYMRLMKHWERVLPAGTILDLPYEDMVTNTEAQSKRVLEFVGLPWNADCLEFYKNERLVKTASVAQVRKPIYQTSVARWKHFARHLKPLYELVKQYRDPQDLPNFDLPISNQNLTQTQTQIPSAISPATSSFQAVIEQCLALQGKGEHGAAIQLLNSYLPQLGGDGEAAVFWHLHGISLYRLDRFEEARSSYEMALQIQPQFPVALNSLGFLLQDMGLIEQAHTCFEKALSFAPEMAMARLNLGMAQLKLGDFENGWENYEARWTGSAESAMGTFIRPACPLPQWNGESQTQDKRLLVITEQGFGDTFQFARYLAQIAPHFAKVGFVCSAPTLRLMEWAGANQIVLLTQLPLDYSTWDWQCALMSLPRVCKTRLDSIPANVPYLHVPNAPKAHWFDRLNTAAPGRFKVGIAWAGRKVHQYDGRRSMAFNQLTPLLRLPYITWVSLQKWAPEDTRPNIPEAVDWIDWTEELTDFADTAALVENLDLVISIDSSMIHLSGALNKPVWMLNRFDTEWRWLHGRSDSPWYPSLRIFNQPRFGDWESVITRVVAELASLPIPQVPAKARVDKIVASGNSGSLPPAAPLQNLTIEQAIQLASQYHVSNQLEQAEQVLRQILRVHPKHAHSLHLLGVITYQAGKAILALDLVRQAIASDPTVALFESNLAEMCRQQNRFVEAIEHGKKAVALDPTMASAYSNLGIALFDIKNYDGAQAVHEKALAINSQLLHSLNNMGSIERARGNKVLALEWYRKALNVNEDYLEALINIGAILVEEDRAHEALAPLLKVLAIQPNSPEALCNLGLSYFKLEEYDKAQSLLRRSLQNRPYYLEALVGLARVLQEVDRLPEALALLKQAVSQVDAPADAWCQLGALYSEMAEPDLAKESFDRALILDPACVDALTGLANLSLELGEVNKSKELLKSALSFDGNNIAARFHLIQAEKVKAGDDNLVALEALSVNIKKLSHEKQISLHYALGKAYDDLGEFRKAFPQFLEGARLKRAKLNFSPDTEIQSIDNLMHGLTPERYRELSGAGVNDATPIFILGMPRSGTTLTEQIIASHPLVHGAGELRDLLEVVQDPGADGQGFPGNLAGLTKEKLSQWGEEYLGRLRTHSNDALRITDKMPSNYLAMGLIPLMLPKAKIIHVKRDPIDTCVSCFTRLFNRHQDATYDLTELGIHYCNYARLMDYWRKFMPSDRFLEIEYEDIVADIETQARKLIDWVGLDWDKACLDFYKTKRSIRTASLTQVRQPIYSSSIERWKNYEEFLGPLLLELDPILNAGSKAI